MLFVYYNEIPLNSPTLVGLIDDPEPALISPPQRFDCLDAFLRMFGYDPPNRQLLQICDLLEPHAFKWCVFTYNLLRNEEAAFKIKALFPLVWALLLLLQP